MSYTPSKKYLDRYARVLVNYALNSGQGIRPGEVVFLQVPESAKALLFSLYEAVLLAKAHPIVQYLPDEMEYQFFNLASDDQLSFFPAKFLKGKVEQADHFLTILAETNLHELEGVDPQKIMQKNIALKPYLDWRHKKESRGKFTWTLGLFPTPAMAKEAGLSLKECWHQVIKACYLDNHNPINKWRAIGQEIDRLRQELNSLDIDSLNITSEGTDLTIGLDENRRWLGGDGRNIPSFEIFISPDFRRTQGHISFNMPLYRYGNEIRDIYLEFNRGIVVNAHASKGESVLKKMIATKNADKVGEFSLTDVRLSRIDKFMAETLYDENFGGKHGNTHIALGASFPESYTGNFSNMSSRQLYSLGFNDSVVHTDIISTTNRKVVANLNNGEKITIYQNGQFTV